MTCIPRLRADTGLCEYEHPDNFFRANSGAREAARICTNCPVIVSCAEKALSLGVADGVWATVVMPGGRNAAALEAARARLREVIDRYRHQPPELRLRSLQIRRAMHFAAVQRHMRSRPITHPQTAATEKASA
jgi:WhiB family transcriptional regulator, redox-sensing transcriptional regulator